MENKRKFSPTFARASKCQIWRLWGSLDDPPKSWVAKDLNWELEYTPAATVNQEYDISKCKKFLFSRLQTYKN